MPRPPNYNQQRGDRNRAKEEKKQERLRRRDEEAAKRRAANTEGAPSDAAPASPATIKERT
ncbi:MAG TPA: hypothetical protein VFB16_04795 [Bauldia sp.]|nr:hypothetical protein [Bauldia sp.]